MDEISLRLTQWYDANRRDLPWRATRDAYAIWVSEVILQQTRVEQGLSYYLRFMHELPTVEALAAADEDRVMRLWQGLGYYSRARHMMEAARQVVALGGFPTTYEGLLSLKGIGAYTAAAISSFAWGTKVAVVDGNVYRVLSRLFDVETPIDTGVGQRMIARLADELLPEGDTSRHNQALMELGALVCVPSHPDCEGCPLADCCAAAAAGHVAERPVKSHRTKVRERWFDYCHVHNADSLYLRKRPAGDIWQGLYELPLVETDAVGGGEVGGFFSTGRDAAGNAVPPLFDEAMPVTRFALCRSRKHVLSHQIIHARLFEAVIDGPLPARADYIIVKADEVEKYALPRLIQLLLE